MNTYSYVGGNPINSYDIYGLDATGKSPNPIKIKPGVPFIDLVCDAHGAICSIRERELKNESERFLKNIKIIEMECDARYQRCVFSELSVSECWDSLKAGCDTQREEEFKRNLEAINRIKENYPINEDFKKFCDNFKP